MAVEVEMGREERNTSGAAPLSLSRRQDSGRSVVRVGGKVSSTTRAKPCTYLDRVTACAASGASLSAAHERATRRYGCRLRLVCTAGHMRRILTVTGMPRSAPVHRRVGEAPAGGSGTEPQSGTAASR